MSAVRSCEYEAKLARSRSKGKSPNHGTQNRWRIECAADGCVLCRAYFRIAEIHVENARAAASAKTCPGCTCTRRDRCVLVDRELRAIGLCTPAGEVPGETVCSACLSPDARGNARAARAWFERTSLEDLAGQDLWTPDQGLTQALAWLDSVGGAR